MKREHEVRVPASFWLSTHLSFDAKALYNLLLIFVNWSTGETFVSNQRLQLITRWGRDKIKRLLAELERAHFIKRQRELSKNLKAKRHITCLKYAISSSDGLKTSPSVDGLVFGTTEKAPVSLHKEKPIPKTPLPPAEAGGQVVYVERYGEIIEVQMGRHRRLPNLDSTTGARAQQLAEFLSRHEFPARVIRKE